MFAIGVLGAILFSGTLVGTLYFIKEFLDEAFIRQNRDMLWFVPLGVVVIFVVRGIGDYMSSYFPGYVGRQVVKALRGELFAKYMHLPVSFYDRSSTAQMMSRLTYNVELLVEAATTALVNLIRDSLSFLVSLGYLFYLDWRLASIIILLAPPLSWLLR